MCSKIYKSIEYLFAVPVTEAIESKTVNNGLARPFPLIQLSASNQNNYCIQGFDVYLQILLSPLTRLLTKTREYMATEKRPFLLG